MKSNEKTANRKETMGFLARHLKKADFVLLAVLVAVGLAMTILVVGFSHGGQKITVSVDGKTFGTYRLTQNKTIRIKNNGHTNIIEIKDGKATMKYSSCRNQICVNHKAISKTNEQIVCLPNRVLVRVDGKAGKDDVDVVTQP